MKEIAQLAMDLTEAEITIDTMLTTQNMLIDALKMQAKINEEKTEQVRVLQEQLNYLNSRVEWLESMQGC